MAFKSLVGKMVELFERAAAKLGRNTAPRVRRLARRDTGSMLPFLSNKKFTEEKRKDSIRNKAKKAREEEEEVWRRTIMMGEKCEPLEFSGVILYDAEGKQVATAPRSPLPENKNSLFSSLQRL